MHNAWHQTYQEAQLAARQGDFQELATLCRKAREKGCQEPDFLLAAGNLLLGCGLLEEAHACFAQGRQTAPDDLRFQLNLVNCQLQYGEHEAAHRGYAELLTVLPNHAVVRRNLLTSLEYNPAASDRERFDAAVAWGRWAEKLAGGPRSRPPLRPLQGQPLRVGYVSPDFCQHTVGLFFKDVCAGHDREQVMPFAYSVGTRQDWVTAGIRACCTFRDVSPLDDGALADLIRGDGIDLLVDLSGHTAGSRLTLFAHRPAPVQVSWLGYFATTGLACMDAVLLDDWHAPDGMESWFSERIIRLSQGRLCYSPVPFAPAVAPLPCLTRGFVTFGCFNNTMKLHPGVLELWAQIMRQVPDSRLILKWFTLHDQRLQDSIRSRFAASGIDACRVELRGPSVHADLLMEYADIDIALDPFPFSGGLTSCEALWMGVPLITWPQSRVVSRQGLALLSAIGLQELVANSPDEYAGHAVQLAGDPERLSLLRATLRNRMASSALCDLRRFTPALEEVYRQLYETIAAES